MGPFGMDPLPDIPENFTGLKCQRIDESAGHVFEDKSMDVKQMLSEPQHENMPVDDFLGIDKENTGRGLKMEEISLGFDFGFMSTYGGLDSCNTLDAEAGLKFEIFNGFLDQVDEVEDIYATQDFSVIGDHFLLDTKLTGKASELDCGVYGSLNSSSESHSSGISGSIDSQVGPLEPRKETVPQSEGPHMPHDEVVFLEPVKEFFGSTPNHIQSRYESDDDKKPLATFISSQTEPGMHRNKLHKATRRLDSLGGTNLHSSYDFRPRRGHLKKCQSTIEEVDIESDHELDASDSEDDHPVSNTSKSRGDRRKHQRMWTLAEVVKLVDGISQFGVGKWTDIKNLLFQSAAHRTPIDLRDKWRNLLRASYANKEGHKHSNGEVAEKPRSVVRPLPKHILHRVRELAALHPYPHAKFSGSVHETSLAHPSVNAPRVRRTSRRKKRC